MNGENYSIKIVFFYLLFLLGYVLTRQLAVRNDEMSQLFNSILSYLEKIKNFSFKLQSSLFGHVKHLNSFFFNFWFL